MIATTPQTTTDNLTDEQIESYRENGFVRIPGIISSEEAATFREAALELAEKGRTFSNETVFQQLVNVWTQNETAKVLTMHPNIAAVAEKLAGVSLRLWHDQILIKKPHNEAPTEFHQDQPYWPHVDSPNPITCWVALCDVPVERGCMTFIPGSQRYTELPPQDLRDPNSLFTICPELVWNERVTVPLRAGDCTFHHGRNAHMATPNFTDEPRVAQAIIFMDAETKFDGRPHVVTVPLKFEKGDTLDGEFFPLAADFR